MARKQDHESRRGKDKVKAVVNLLQKDGPLPPSKKAFCDNACIQRFLKARGNSSKRAAKLLKACLAFRDAIGIEYLTADEFPSELAEGIAYVAGRDHDNRPVIIVRIKPDYQKRENWQKTYVRLLILTMEVAIASMPSSIEHSVLLFDAGDFKSGSTCLNFVMATLKILSENYPGRISRTFVIDPPIVFNYLWKGVKPFVDSDLNLQIVCSLDYDSPFMSGLARATSLRHDMGRPNGGSFRFSTKTSTGSAHCSPRCWDKERTQAYPIGPSLLSPFNARCLSFASPSTTTNPIKETNFIYDFQSFRFDGATATPRTRCSTPRSTWTPLHDHFPSKQFSPRTEFVASWTPSRNLKPKKHSSPRAIEGIASFFQGLKKDAPKTETLKKERSMDFFRPYLRHYRFAYDEAKYRSMMKPPLGGLASIVSPELKKAPAYDVRRACYGYDLRRSSYEFKR